MPGKSFKRIPQAAKAATKVDQCFFDLLVAPCRELQQTSGGDVVPPKLVWVEAQELVGDAARGKQVRHAMTNSLFDAC